MNGMDNNKALNAVRELAKPSKGIASSFKRIVKQVALCLVGVVLLLGLMQPVVLAASVDMQTDVNPSMSSESLEQKRAERREIQSKASEAANTEESVDSVGEALGDKLNLTEIVEENEIVGGVKKALDSDDVK